MATTVREIFTMTMSIVDNLDTATGKAISEDNKEYEKRTPSILNVLQSELINKEKITNTLSYNYDNSGVWQIEKLPNDFNKIKKIVIENGNTYSRNIEYRIENNSIKFKSNETGVIKMEYKQTPELLTSLSDEVTLSDDIARSVLTYGLGANLFIIENPSLANFCQQKYEENKRDATSQKSPVTMERINVVYGDIYGND